MADLSNNVAAQPAAPTAFFTPQSLKNAKVAPVDLMDNYWTPEKIGEAKNLYFLRIGIRAALEQGTEEIVELLTVYFLEEGDDGVWRELCNSSTHLVSRFEKGDIKAQTPVYVTYKGKKKNKTNANMSDWWGVSPLSI